MLRHLLCVVALALISAFVLVLISPVYFAYPTLKDLEAFPLPEIGMRVILLVDNPQKVLPTFCALESLLLETGKLHLIHMPTNTLVGSDLPFKSLEDQMKQFILDEEVQTIFVAGNTPLNLTNKALSDDSLSFVRLYALEDPPHPYIQHLGPLAILAMLIDILLDTVFRTFVAFEFQYTSRPWSRYLEFSAAVTRRAIGTPSFPELVFTSGVGNWWRVITDVRGEMGWTFSPYAWVNVWAEVHPLRGQE
ncbi:hypothetical protein VNI00_013462 [Paramarasmius palmivorus]|uniref:Uncharacterized protein n=1 Tax=Paramarasmius palmivorus TaxID=297713 RepID=A0AAW0C126_9AGAR